MEKSSDFNKFVISKGIRYNTEQTSNFNFSIINLSVEKAVKD